ncbi:Ancient ubiquitous protein 1 [Homalodisca vitripennis]|nr:Ancient ubiquitous protein 1 [Homalodisca vitripennis]
MQTANVNENLRLELRLTRNAGCKVKTEQIDLTLMITENDKIFFVLQRHRQFLFTGCRLIYDSDLNIEFGIGSATNSAGSCSCIVVSLLVEFVSGWHLLGVVFYSPIGLVLALLRVFISLQAYLLALLLLIPELSFIRGLVLRLIGLVLGIFVIEENPSQRDKSVKVLVANNVTVLDHIPVHLVTGCFSPSAWDVWPLCLKVFEGSQDKHTFSTNLRNHLSSCIAPLLLQPEETPTNGRVGLLRCAKFDHAIRYTMSDFDGQASCVIFVYTELIQAKGMTQIPLPDFYGDFRFALLALLEKKINSSSSKFEAQITSVPLITNRIINILKADLFNPFILEKLAGRCDWLLGPVCLLPWRPLEITTSTVSASSTDLFMFLFSPTLLTQFSPWCATVALTVQPVCLLPWRPLEITTSTVSASSTDLFMFLFSPTLLTQFSPWCATVALTVQPVCLQPWRPLEITTSTVSASFTDLFMFLFSPFSPWCATVAPTVQPVYLQPWRPLEITTSTVSASFTDLFMFLFSPSLLTQFSPWCATVAPTVQPVYLQPWRPLEITTSTVPGTFSTDLFMFLFSPTLLTQFSPWCATVALTVQPVCPQPWRPLEITTSTVSASFTDLFMFLFSPTLLTQ